MRGQHDESTQSSDDPAAQRSNNWQGVCQGFAAACGCVDAQVVRAAVQRPPNCCLHRKKAVDAASLERRYQPSVEGDAGGVKLYVALAVQRVSVSHPCQRSGGMALGRRRSGCRRRRKGRRVTHGSAIVVNSAAAVAVAFRSKRCVYRGRLRSTLSGNHARQQVSRTETATLPKCLFASLTSRVERDSNGSTRWLTAARSVRVCTCVVVCGQPVPARTVRLQFVRKNGAPHDCARKSEVARYRSTVRRRSALRVRLRSRQLLAHN